MLLGGKGILVLAFDWRNENGVIFVPSSVIKLFKDLIDLFLKRTDFLARMASTILEFLLLKVDIQRSKLLLFRYDASFSIWIVDSQDISAYGLKSMICLYHSCDIILWSLNVATELDEVLDDTARL